MLKNFSTKLFELFILTLVLLIFENFNNCALANVSDAPWETASNGVPVQQQLSNDREIYYQIVNNDKNTELFKKAVNNWNQLGVIKLVQVQYGDPKVQITMSTKVIEHTDAMGETPFDWTISNSNQNVAYMSNTFVELANYNYQFSKHDKLITAEHEIGHALGFAHDNRMINDSKTSTKDGLIMNAKNVKHYEPLGRIEQQTLANQYHLQPTTGWLNNYY